MKEGLRPLLGHALAAPPGANADGGAKQHLSPEQEAAAGAIARRTMSPFCPGRTLSDCPSEYAAEWRRDIRQLIAEGRSAAEIQDELERRAGANLSGSPARDSSYWVPATFAVLGLAVLGGIFMRLRRSSEQTNERAQAPKAGSPESPVDDARLEAELAAEDDER